ncbi:DUF4382 domain-containing protein [Thaumasiovibrio sp. DFM-14]|uniref:DUF4382 domain-containing protein n=1 Tax=Thaumasiovibrio sp. DFM-14 TaxID=3384792 RepID=UPI0039A259E6
MRRIGSVAVILTPFLLAACGGSDDPTMATAQVSFSVSDAPVDSATEVVVAFDALELRHEDGQRFFISVDENVAGDDYQQIDLLKYPGSEEALILTDQRLPIGTYKELIIHTKAQQDLNWVLTEDEGEFDLKIPSNKLKLGGFEVTTETVQSFTIEFDLRQSLVLRGNNGNNNGYNLKPHGVKIVDNSAAASLKGHVDVNLLGAGDGCLAETGNFVYLYAGHGHQDSVLIDNIDITDPDYRDEIELPLDYVAPYASTGVMDDGNYFFGFIPAGDYTVAFTCSATVDNPIQYDEIIIANPSEQVAEIELLATQEKVFDFTE